MQNSGIEISVCATKTFTSQMVVLLRTALALGKMLKSNESELQAVEAELSNVPQLIEAVVAINDERKKKMADRVILACGGSIEGKTIAVLGLTFKPNTDDMRDSPVLDIIPILQAAGAKIRAFDPAGMNEAKSLLKDVTYVEGTYQTLEGADAVVIVTEWDEFRALDLERVKTLLKTPIMIDLRNIYNPAEMAELGIEYHSIGRAFKAPA